jgi:uncharacterized protein (DUF58 family)
MIVPAPRLLWISMLAVLPAASLAGLVPRLFVPAVGILAVCAGIAIIDAVRGIHRLENVRLALPPYLRLTKNVAAVLPVQIETPAAMKLALVMPEGMESPRITEPLQPSPRQELNWPVTGTVRGDHPLGTLHVETASPLGFWAVREARTVDCTFRVYPNLRDRATAALFLKSGYPGLRRRQQIGKGREFDNLRHYLPGDSFEDIHWKATARRAYPVVKLYRVEHAQEVYAVIDSSRLSAREGILEGYVDAALHLALVAERQGDHFGLVTFSGRTQRFVRARGGMDHFRVCRETIYNLRAERVSPDFREVFTSLQLHLRRRCLLVFFTSLDDALLAETFDREIPLLARRHLVLVNVTRTSAMTPLFAGTPPPDIDAAYEGLAGQMLWNRMAALRLALHNRGVKLTIVQPERIKTEVTAQYLEVKRRQML